jgi:hypothetical protein
MARILGQLGVVIGAVGLGALAVTPGAQAASCSTVSDARLIIQSAATQAALVSAVGESVPSDVANCVPSFCAASVDASPEVQVAVGAGISEAYAQLTGSENEDGATALRSSACSVACTEAVVTAFAASQASSVSRLCEASDGSGTGAVGSILQVGAGGGGGGAASDVVSPN